jgi:hypothetical protein
VSAFRDRIGQYEPGAWDNILKVLQPLRELSTQLKEVQKLSEQAAALEEAAEEERKSVADVESASDFLR